MSAARDLVARGAVVAATGGTLLAQAGGQVDVAAVTQLHALDIDLGGQSHSKASETTKAGASLSAARDLVIAAGGQVALVGAKLEAGQDVLVQGRDVTIAAAVDRAVVDTGLVFRHSSSLAQSDHQSAAGGSVQAGGNLAIQAGGKAALTGAQVVAAGQAAIVAAGDIDIGALQLQHSTHDESFFQSNGGLTAKSTATTSSAQWTTLAGSHLAGDTLRLHAGDTARGTGDLRLSASGLQATGAASLQAGRDLVIEAGQQSSHSSSARVSQTQASGWGKLADVFADPSALLTRAQGQATDTRAQTVNVGASVSVGALQAQAGRDLTVKGSTVVADGDIALRAGRDLTLTTAQDTSADQSASATRKSGNLGSFVQQSYGVLKENAQGTSSSTTQVGSQVASLGGQIAAQAGNQYTQTGSALLAQKGDIAVQARQIDIGAAFDAQAQTRHQEMSKASLGGAVQGGLIDAVKAATTITNEIGRTQDSRMQALAALDAALQATNAAKAAADMVAKGVSMRVEVSLGSQKARSEDSLDSIKAVGSRIVAGGNVSLEATGAGGGAGPQSTLKVTGSDVKAGGTATLRSEGALTLEAAQSGQTQKSSNHSSSGSIGVGFGVGQQSGFTLDLGASMGQGRTNGTATTWTNTHVDAGTVALQSGGDTTLQGAVVSGGQVQAKVGGDLKVESLQDIVKFDGKQMNASVGVSLCIPPFCYGASSASGSFAQAKVDGRFASVGEQSGIHAGDGGFQIAANGGTTLTGGVLTSSQAAMDAGRNRLSTATLVSSDLKNHDDFKGTAVGVSASVSGGGKTPADSRRSSPNTPGVQPAFGVGLDSGHQSSTTVSGISGGTLTTGDGSGAGIDRDVRTGQDTSGHLTQQWDGQEVLGQVQASERIMQTAMPALAKAIGDYAAKQMKPTDDAHLYLNLLAKQQDGGLSDTEQKVFTKLESDGVTPTTAQQTLDDPKQQQTYESWKEGGIYRVAAHTVLGALGGGVDGALGGGLSAAATPTVADQLAHLDVSDSTRQALIAGFGLAAGSVGGLQGAASGFDIVTNNYLKHEQVDQMMGRLRDAKTQKERDDILAQYAALSKQQSSQMASCTGDDCKKIQSDIAAGQVALTNNYDALKNLAGGFLHLNGSRLDITDQQAKDESIIDSRIQFNTVATQHQKELATRGLSKAVVDQLVASDRCIDAACATEQYQALQKLKAKVSGADAIAVVNGMDQLRGRASTRGACIPGTGCEAFVGVANVAIGISTLGTGAQQNAASQGRRPPTAGTGQSAVNTPPDAPATGSGFDSSRLGYGDVTTSFGGSAVKPSVPSGKTPEVVWAPGSGGFSSGLVETPAMSAGKQLAGGVNISEGVTLNFKPFGGELGASDFLSLSPEISTRFVDGVVVVDQRTGQAHIGTVDLQPTLDRIDNGIPYPHRNDGSVFKNRPPVGGNGQPLLPAQPSGYYTEYVVPTPGVNGPGPQRIVVGKNGEMYYTPDHYATFIPIKH